MKTKPIYRPDTRPVRGEKAPEKIGTGYQSDDGRTFRKVARGTYETADGKIWLSERPSEDL